MEINKEILDRLSQNKLLLDEYYILYSEINNLDWGYKPFGIYYVRLIQRGYLDIHQKITPEGIAFYNELINLNKSNLDIEFEEFWNAYPADDRWANYLPTRRIRTNKLKARLLYNTVRKEYNNSKLIEGLTNEVNIRKKTSISQNNMTYMQNICTWLNNKTFESFIDKKVEDNNNQYGKDLM